MNILGLDIGYGKCGYSILKHKKDINSNDIYRTGEIISVGTITTPKEDSIQSRLNELYTDLENIKKAYKPKIVVIEKLYYYRKNTVFEKICMAKGIAYLVFNKKRIIEIEPKVLKKEIVGNGKASKSDIRQILKNVMKHNLKGVSDDALDAYCLSIYGSVLIKYEKNKVT